MGHHAGRWYYYFHHSLTHCAGLWTVSLRHGPRFYSFILFNLICDAGNQVCTPGIRFVPLGTTGIRFVPQASGLYHWGRRESFNKLRVTSIAVSTLLSAVSLDSETTSSTPSTIPRPLSGRRPGRCLQFSAGDSVPSGSLGFSC